MNASRLSSTRSAEHWSVNISASTTFSVVFTCFTLLALYAVWLCPLDAPVRLVLIATICTGSIFIWRQACERVTLSLSDDDEWNMQRGTELISGSLASGCYRSSKVMVVAIKPAHGRTRHCMIWRDAVSAADFSRVQIRLALTRANSLH